MLAGSSNNITVFAKILFNGKDDLVEMCLFEKIKGRTILRCSMVSDPDLSVNIISSLIMTGEIQQSVTVYDSEDLVQKFTKAGILVNVLNNTIN